MNRVEDDQQLPLFRMHKDNAVIESAATAVHTDQSTPFSQYVVYVDESGDHSLVSIDKNYPVFVLALCVFHKRHYSEAIVPAFEKFKFNHFGHDQVVLHENEIRKEKGKFNIFKGRAEKQHFLGELTEIVDQKNFILISCTIDKRKVSSNNVQELHSYHMALKFCMELLYDFLKEKQQHILVTHVVVEQRGKKEDEALELEFRRICDGSNRAGCALPFRVIFSDKKAMSTGLQLADLVARPIGLRTLRPEQENQAFDVLKKKFYCREGREMAGQGAEWLGMKIYPSSDSEKPR